MTLEAGSLVVIPFPFSDLTATKRRPVLLLNNPDSYGDFIAMPVTSQAGHPKTILIRTLDMQTGHLPKISWIRYDKPVSLNGSLVVKEIGTVTPSLRSQAARALCAQIAPIMEIE